jgi:hypothetical protein
MNKDARVTGSMTVGLPDYGPRLLAELPQT